MNKTENTLENKAKFFALYYKQTVLKTTDDEHESVGNYLLTLNNPFMSLIENDKGIYYLELTPLSQITQEDACHICMLLVQWQDSMQNLSKVNVRERIDGEHGDVKIVFEFVGSFQYTIRLINGDWLGWIDSNGRCEWTLFNIQQVNDYLRSKGYALPWMDLSVEDLVSYGWVKLKS